MKQHWLWICLRGYLGERRWTALWAAAAVGIFALVSSLMGLNAFAVAYAATLSGVIGLIGLTVGFAAYSRRYRALHQLTMGTLNLQSPLPAPRGLMEESYHQALKRALGENARLSRETGEASRRQLETYSLWTHQIKVPISAMRLVLQQRANGADAALLAELLKVEQYTDMALNYARLNASSTDYVIREYPLDDILRQLIRKFAPLFIQNKLKLNYQPANATVITDEKWLLFALEQVLSNAIKYTPKGGGITLAYQAEGALLTVSDTGIGVSPEDMPRVFEQGYTGYNGRSDKRATGLGLYLCKQTLNRLGHTIRLESEAGKGTTVTVGLKREESVYE